MLPKIKPVYSPTHVGQKLPVKMFSLLTTDLKKTDMSDLYSVRSSGKLKLKGEKETKKSSKKAKKRKHHDEEGGPPREESKSERKKAKAAAKQDVEDHGGWWQAQEFKHVTGPIAIEFNNCYIKVPEKKNQKNYNIDERASKKFGPSLHFHACAYKRMILFLPDP